MTGRPIVDLSGTLSGIGRGARWAKNSFAEWFIGSWALILGWGIIGVIFFSFLQMDGHFSRGLGEGSGVDPGLFQHVGWMYRCFAALFLVLCVKLEHIGLKGSAVATKILGGAITVIVILHATGFGLTALSGKALNADAVVQTVQTAGDSNATVITALEAQKASIRDDLAKQVAPLNEEVARLDTDGKRNEDLANTQKQRRKELEDKANGKIDEIDKLILSRTISGADAKTTAVREVTTTQKWSPLFVGLAQLVTQQDKPSDGAIYLCGVLFIIFWVLVGDAIAIILPPTLYKMHLKDAKPRDVRVSPDVFRDLQEQADELAKRKANLADGAERANVTKGKKRNRATSKLLLEDQRSEAVKSEEVAAAAQPDTTENSPDEPDDGADLNDDDGNEGEPGSAEPDEGGRGPEAGSVSGHGEAA